MLFYRNRTLTVTSTVDNSSVLVEKGLLRAQRLVQIHFCSQWIHSKCNLLFSPIIYFYRTNQYTFPTRFHVIHKYSLYIRKETCFFFLYDLIIKIVNFHGRSGKLWTIKRIMSAYNVCDLVSSTIRKFIHSICCKMYMYKFHFTKIGNLFVSILR